MRVLFSKYSGAGNDFVLVDNRIPFFSASWIPKICDRREGVGGDGVILLEHGSVKPYKMRIFNADGSEAEMCGNGLRTLTKFIKELGINQETYEIENVEGKIFETTLTKEGVATKMISPFDCQWNLTLEDKTLHYLNTGVPHIICFLKNIDVLDVKKEGAFYRSHKNFQPKGTNVNFVTIDSPKTLSVRTYERGVEDETFACGTGSVAAAIAAAKIYDLTPPLNVKVRSGSFLKIDFKRDQERFFDIIMEGEAKQIFNGSIIL